MLETFPAAEHPHTVDSHTIITRTPSRCAHPHLSIRGVMKSMVLFLFKSKKECHQKASGDEKGRTVPSCNSAALLLCPSFIIISYAQGRVRHCYMLVFLSASHILFQSIYHRFYFYPRSYQFQDHQCFFFLLNWINLNGNEFFSPIQLLKEDGNTTQKKNFFSFFFFFIFFYFR